MSMMETLKGRALRPGHPLYDEDARKELDRRMSVIGRKKAIADLARWEEGFHFITIRDKKLFFQDGFDTMTEWVSRKARRARRTVSRRMRLAENFSKEQVIKYGADVLELVLDYVARTVAKDEPWQLEQLELVVPTQHGVESVPFSKSEPWHLEAALAHQKTLAERRTTDALADAAQSVVERLTGAVTHDGRPLADIRATPPATGHVDDTELQISLRLGDLEAVIARLQTELAARARKRG